MNRLTRGILLKNLRAITQEMSRFQSDYASFKKILDKAQNIIALTGAGVSAESGIPVFRGAGGWWRNHRATELATPEAFQRNPALVWEFYHYRRNIAFNSIPNNAHYALALYEERCKQEGRQFHIITQNVDGLHFRAGSKEVIELHGSLTKVKCTKCKFIDVNIDNPICEALKDKGDPIAKDTNESQIPIDELPKCSKCGSLVRPYIVWFGEMLDPETIEKAMSLVETADMCIVVGTSSVVYPAAMFAPTIAERGKPVAEFNINEEPASDDFKFYFNGKCGITLPKALGVNL
ncbi:NAD-dependent protein deacylase-like [Onthophagus taurus]|uniref:NAD-dependent protein deacylase-like n=1 Tax=Onthophagus taurus TaxID=166361 RepID=UPI000C20C469|nr:NAD-dependent protein deacylase-like [Onthophagus taurus]